MLTNKIYPIAFLAAVFHEKNFFKKYPPFFNPLTLLHNEYGIYMKPAIVIFRAMIFITLYFILVLSAECGDGKLPIMSVTNGVIADETIPLPEEVIVPIPSLLPQAYTMNESGGTETPAQIQVKVYQPVQNVLVLWNGKANADGEEILVMSENSRSSVGSGAVLSILPLPGRFISISHHEADTFPVFNKTKAAIVKKWDSVLRVGPDSFPSSFKANPDTKKPPFFFVWKMNDFDRLKTCISYQISKYYQDQAVLAFHPDEEKVLKNYFDRGFRYFVFEIKEYDSKDFTDSGVVTYRFQSTNLYYPLVISQIGGQGRTLVDIVALTPCTLTFPENGFTLKTPENMEGQVMLNGKGTVLFDKSEVKEIDEDLADFTKTWPQIRARNFLISGQINEFVKDFILISDEEVKKIIDDPVVTETPSEQTDKNENDEDKEDMENKEDKKDGVDVNGVSDTVQPA